MADIRKLGTKLTSAVAKAGERANAAKQARVFKTSDGYTFKEMPNGEVTNGDMTWPSAKEFMKDMPNAYQAGDDLGKRKAMVEGYGRPDPENLVGDISKSMPDSPQMQFQRALNKQNAPKPEPKLKAVKPAGGLGQVQANEAISKAAESAGMNAPVTANKDLTTLQDFHTSFGDSVRKRAADMQAIMDSFDYKYDKGQRVFTEDSAKKNWPPMTVLGRVLEGNRIMREDPTDFLSKKIIDEATGKAKRTPHEPGYKVRLEHSPDNWSEFVIPESAIKGNVDMKKGGVLHMADAGKVTKGVVGALTKATEMAKAEKAVPKVDRLSMNYKDVTKRVPEVADALEQLLKGDITKAQYNDIVNTYKPVTPYSFVPKPATKDEAVGALRGDAAKERYGKQAEYTPGSKIGLRLDIPAYTGKGVWVNSIHDEKAKKVAYGPVASVKNADLGISQAESKRIAQGGAKAPYARIKGEWNPISEEEAIAKAQEYLDHPEWRQIGMDPERHSYFYDRRTMQPITNAEEIIQIGPLVLGKNPKYANIDEFDYATGGKVRHMADAGRVTKGVTGALTKAKEMAKAKKAGESKIAEMLAAQQAPMTTPSGTGLPLMPRDQGMYTPREQKDLPRMPTVDKARAEGKSPKYTPRMQDLLDSPTARKKVDKLINQGKDLNMTEWYGTEPLRQVAMDAGRTPEQFESLMAQLASASQRNPVDKQNQMGSYLYHLSETGQLPENALLLTNKLKKALKEDPSLAEGRTLIELPKGYGSLAQGDIFDRAVQIGQGDIAGALPPNKKLGTFYENLLGNLQPVTVDVNAVRGPIIERGDPRWLTSKLVEKDETGKVTASYKPREMFDTGEMTMREAKQRPGFWEAAPSGSEYAGFEDLWQRGAKRHGVKPAEAQALGWYGSADVTALKTKPENYVDNLERLIKRTAEQTGKSATEVMNDMVTGKGFLRKEGGAVDRKADKAMMMADLRLRAMIDEKMNMAKGGRVSIFDAPAKKMSKGGSSDEPTAREVAEQLGKLAVEQGKEEYESFKKPRAATDIGNRGILAPALGLPVDMMNMGLSGVDALAGLMGKPTRLSSEKPFAGSEHIKDLMDRYGVTSGEDRPMTETMLSLFSPTGMIKGAQGMTKGAVKAADAMRRPRAGAMREKTN
jgi:hypothetical protein